MSPPCTGRSTPAVLTVLLDSFEAMDRKFRECRIEYEAYKKALADFEHLCNGLLQSTSPEDELSVCAQQMLNDQIVKVNAAAKKLAEVHRSVHSVISKIGKDLNRHFYPTVTDLFRSEADIERDAKCARNVSNLIVAYLLSSGNHEIAEVFINECSLTGRLDNVNQSKALFEPVLSEFRRRNAMPAIEILERRYPPEERLLADVIRVQVVHFIEQGEKLRALQLARKLPSLGSENEVRQLMSAFYNNTSEFYKEMADEASWVQLELRLSDILYELKSTLPEILQTGCFAVPKLTKINETMAHRQMELLRADELPIEIPVAQRLHTVFTCPILRTQATLTNPPYRLKCGHVISKEALEKLAATSRHFRLKCPYCPEDCSKEDAVQIFF